jgi:hypothetical protein
MFRVAAAFRSRSLRAPEIKSVSMLRHPRASLVRFDERRIAGRNATAYTALIAPATDRQRGGISCELLA